MTFHRSFPHEQQGYQTQTLKVQFETQASEPSSLVYSIFHQRYHHVEQIGNLGKAVKVDY
ncbi:hypothetical protein ZIOFF_010231 [Zingiber officinale]|uniref:Uncharacterized protein n=1 Tax=Zingiber officinale TaxID=94328 RepID=A0A8J5HP56_ZINOF|nr:hypothetical protein ZIOFF_010231 [Zingiber officinale]